MVGDGINDAPGPGPRRRRPGHRRHRHRHRRRGRRHRLHGRSACGSLPLLLRLSRETVRIIRQNILIFAFGVNAVGIILTAWLWPLLAPPAGTSKRRSPPSIYHQIGSLAVLLNSMRLLWFERSRDQPDADPACAGGLRRVNDWLEHRLDLDEAAALAVAPLAAGAGRAGAPAAGAAGRLSGFTPIGADEVGVVRHFGRPLPDDLDRVCTGAGRGRSSTVTRVQPRPRAYRRDRLPHRRRQRAGPSTACRGRACTATTAFAACRKRPS